MSLQPGSPFVLSGGLAGGPFPLRVEAARLSDGTGQADRHQRRGSTFSGRMSAGTSRATSEMVL